MRSHPLPNALHRHLFARNEIARDESTAGRGKGIAVMRVVVDAQRCAVFEDDAPRAFNLDGEQIEWIPEPADFKFLAIERARFDGAAVIVRHELVLLVTAPDPCALVWKCIRAGLAAGHDQVGRAAVEWDMEFRIWEARALNNRLIVPGQQTLCFAQTRDAHGLKILFEEGASGIQIRTPHTHGFAADVRKGLGDLPALSALYFAQGLATRIIGCEDRRSAVPGTNRTDREIAKGHPGA